MNKKEIFYKVAEHLVKQGRKAKDATGDFCQYYAPNGDKCAVGCLIPQGLYEKKIEGCGVTGPTLEPILKKMGVAKHVEFLSSLQTIHDSSDVADWGRRLGKIAREKKWKIPDCVRA